MCVDVCVCARESFGFLVLFCFFFVVLFCFLLGRVGGGGRKGRELLR